MIKLIEDKMERLRALCEKYRVARLDLFGSATTDEWNPIQSDLDFLVTFNPPPAEMGGFDQYMDFLLDLQRLFLRKVDLVEESAVKNKYFIAAVNQQRVSVYVKAAA
ncbi:MAG: nucleotidyltransferase domain-containing protein [Phycisphaeraceae bacterium]